MVLVETRIIIALLAHRGIGRRTVRQILDVAKAPICSVAELMGAISDARNDGVRVPAVDAGELEKSLQEVDRQLDSGHEIGVTAIGVTDPHFPLRLRGIPDPPVVLYVKGNLDCLNPTTSVAVIGTREPSPWGKKMGERFGARFAQAGAVVVSGLALGCDAAAHWGCVNAGGLAVAVLAHGLHTVYPKENRDLAERLLENGGALVSEYPAGTRAFSSFFVERDRLQSGMSDGVVVVETDITGGTMHTVKACISQGRLLACLSHSEKFGKTEKCRGNRALMAEGKAIALGDEPSLMNFINRLATTDAATSTTNIVVEKESGADLLFGPP